MYLVLKFKLLSVCLLIGLNIFLSLYFYVNFIFVLVYTLDFLYDKNIFLSVN